MVKISTKSITSVNGLPPANTPLVELLAAVTCSTETVLSPKSVALPVDAIVIKLITSVFDGL